MQMHSEVLPAGMIYSASLTSSARAGINLLPHVWATPSRSLPAQLQHDDWLFHSLLLSIHTSEYVEPAQVGILSQ